MGAFVSGGGVGNLKNIFEGEEAELLKILDQLGAQAGAAGVGRQEIIDIVKKIGAEDDDISDLLTVEEFEKIVANITTRITKNSAKKAQQIMAKAIKDAGGREQFVTDLEVGGEREEQFRSSLRESLAEGGFNTLLSQTEIINKTHKQILATMEDEEKQAADIAAKESKRLAMTKALGEVERAGIELKAKFNVVSGIEKELELAIALGNASAEEIEKLETKVQLRRIDEK